MPRRWHGDSRECGFFISSVVLAFTSNRRGTTGGGRLDPPAAIGGGATTRVGAGALPGVQRLQLRHAHAAGPGGPGRAHGRGRLPGLGRPSRGVERRRAGSDRRVAIVTRDDTRGRARAVVGVAVVVHHHLVAGQDHPSVDAAAGLVAGHLSYRVSGPGWHFVALSPLKACPALTQTHSAGFTATVSRMVCLF